ncbi:MAG: sigma-70 family RNA polymerase sigma factor [Acidobacteriota bacterium]
MNEKRAIELCLHHRDPIGFEYLAKRFASEAYYHAYSFTGNYEDAADICQESFTKAFIAFPKLEKLEKFYPWFYMILRNSCLNFLRKKKNTLEREPNGSDLITDLTPEANMEKEEKNAEIKEIIFSLKPEFREILLMKYSDNKNYNQISGLLGIPRGTVMSRLYNARKAFKELYQKKKEEKNV